MTGPTRRSIFRGLLGVLAAPVVAKAATAETVNAQLADSALLEQFPGRVVTPKSTGGTRYLGYAALKNEGAPVVFDESHGCNVTKPFKL